jgi:hypothetical protein
MKHSVWDEIGESNYGTWDNRCGLKLKTVSISFNGLTVKVFDQATFTKRV